MIRGKVGLIFYNMYCILLYICTLYLHLSNALVISQFLFLFIDIGSTIGPIIDPIGLQLGDITSGVIFTIITHLKLVYTNLRKKFC